MKILIIEDDFSFALDLELSLKALGYKDVSTLGRCNEVEDYLQKEHVDLLIVDVNLNEKHSGIDLVNKLNNEKAPVIFITALNDEATFREAMLSNPSGFLIKPFDKITLQSCIDGILRRNKKRLDKEEIKDVLLEDCFFIKQNDVLKKIEFDDILWIEADGNYIELFVDDKRFSTKISLTKVQQKMNVSYFVRVHKKFLINVKKIESINSSAELVINGKSIPIGSKYRSDLLAKINSVDY